MSDRAHLVQDLRAHAHEVPAHIGRMMRDAAAAIERFDNFVPVEVLAPPVPPPGPDARGGKHRRPQREAASCR